MCDTYIIVLKSVHMMIKCYEIAFKKPIAFFLIRTDTLPSPIE